MMRKLVICLLLASPALADDAPPTKEQTECQSCTARHKALQKLQKRRLTPPAETTSETISTEKGSSDE